VSSSIWEAPEVAKPGWSAAQPERENCATKGSFGNHCNRRGVGNAEKYATRTGILTGREGRGGGGKGGLQSQRVPSVGGQTRSIDLGVQRKEGKTPYRRSGKRGEERQGHRPELCTGKNTSERKGLFSKRKKKKRHGPCLQKKEKGGPIQKGK